MDNFFRKLQFKLPTKNSSNSVAVTKEEYGKYFDEDKESVIEDSLIFDFEIEMIREGVYKLNGIFKGQLIVFCSRCLDGVIVDEFEIVYHTYKFTENKQLLFDSNDDSITYFNSTYIDIFELVRDELLLNIPDYILCDESCKGLCPECGTNLNESTCNHTEIDV